MPHSFTLNYRNGESEDVFTDAVDAADQINRTFGLNSVEDAATAGVSVIDNGEVEPPEVPDLPDPENDLTGTATSFTATDPTTVVLDTEDTIRLIAKMPTTITLEALTGDEEAKDFIDGQIVEVLTAQPTVTLDLDMSGQNVEGLTADYVINAEVSEAVVEQPKKDPNNPFA